jgi:LuxR family transcriptional regulator, maltose regulon positive regulatory protein
MAFQVLSTKLYNPPIKLGLVRRPRLVQRLENGYQAGKCVTLVSAPAGFGKTTIISEWIATADLGKPFGWVSLDDGDNDPIRFLTYLVTAIQKVHVEIGRSVLAMLQSSQNSNLADLVEALINDISSAPKPFLIVLDDYHLIKNI